MLATLAAIHGDLRGMTAAAEQAVAAAARRATTRDCTRGPPAMNSNSPSRSRSLGTRGMNATAPRQAGRIDVGVGAHLHWVVGDSPGRVHTAAAPWEPARRARPLPDDDRRLTEDGLAHALDSTDAATAVLLSAPAQQPGGHSVSTPPPCTHPGLRRRVRAAALDESARRASTGRDR
jgi:hypothetical protein